MKYKSKIYAKALADLISESKDKHMVENFLSLLKKNRDFKRAKEIIVLAENELLKKTGNRRIILETARETETKDILKKNIKKGDILEEKINPDLVAGLKVTINGERQIDFSLKNKLDNIFLTRS